MAEHTPGPWEWGKSRVRDGYSGLVDSEGNEVLYPDCCNDGDHGAAWFDEFPSESNRTLIAAAPLLLEACKAAKHVYEQGCVDRGWKDAHNWIDEASDLLDAAIAAAKGGA